MSISTDFTLVDLVRLVQRVSSLRGVVSALLPGESLGAGEGDQAPVWSADAAMQCVLSIGVQGDVADATVSRVISFLVSRDALQGGLRFNPAAATHPLIELDLGTELERVASLLATCALPVEQTMCTCSDGGLLLSVAHSEFLCKGFMANCVVYVRQLLLPFCAFLQGEVSGVLRNAHRTWSTYMGSTHVRRHPATLNWGSPAEVVYDLQGRVARIAKKSIDATSGAIDAFTRTSDHLSDALARLAGVASRPPTSDDHVEESALQLHCSTVLASCEAMEEVLRTHPVTQASNLRNSYHSVLSRDDEFVEAVVSALAYLIDRLDAELEFVNASITMASTVAGRIEQRSLHISTMSTEVTQAEVLSRLAIEQEWTTAHEALLRNTQSVRSAVSTPPPKRTQQGNIVSPRQAWWEDASSDDDCDTPQLRPVSSVQQRLQNATIPESTSAKDAPLTLSDQLCLALAQLCKQRLQGQAAPHHMYAPSQHPAVENHANPTSILQGLLEAWRGDAVRTAVHYIAHAHAQRTFRSSSVDMKDLLCSLLDGWSHHLHKYVQPTGMEAPLWSSLLHAGEQAMRDVALVVHLLLPRCRVSIKREVPLDITEGTTDAVILDCPIPEDGEEGTYWCNVFHVLWFQVDPLGTANGGYLFPVAARGEGIAQHAHHSFGFLSITNVTLVMSSPLILQLRYSTQLTLAPSKGMSSGNGDVALYGCTLNQYMKTRRQCSTQLNGSGPSSSQDMDSRIPLMRRVIYSFAKMEKHNILFPIAGDEALLGFACSLDSLNVVPLTEVVVAWLRPADQRSIVSLGVVPPQAIHLVRWCRGASSRQPPIARLDPAAMQQSVIAQLALVVQRLSQLVQPPMLMLAETSTVLLESILAGDTSGNLNEAGIPSDASLTVAAFLCFFDDVVKSIASAPQATVESFLQDSLNMSSGTIIAAPQVDAEHATPREDARRRVDVAQSVVVVAEQPQASGRSFSIQTTVADSSANDYDQDVESYTFSRTRPPPPPSSEHEATDVVHVLKLKASKRTWSSVDDDGSAAASSGDSFVLPELSSKSCSVQSAQVVVRPTAPDAIITRLPSREASPPPPVDLVALPDSLSAPFLIFASQLAASGVKRATSPTASIQRRGASPLRPPVRPLDVFALTARVQVSSSFMEMSVLSVADSRLRDTVLHVGKRLRLPAAVTPGDVIVVRLPDSINDLGDVIPGIQLPIGPQAPQLKSSPLPGKENTGATKSTPRWVFVTRRTNIDDRLGNEIIFVMRVR